MNIFLDLETIPDERPHVREYFAQHIKPPGNIRRVDSREQWEMEEKPAAIEAELRSLALNPWFAQIICVALAVDDEEPEAYALNERDTLTAFNDRIFHFVKRYNSTTFVGHNVLWDLRVIAARCAVHRLPVPPIPYNVKPWSDRIYDTANYLGDKPVSMDKLCLTLGIEGKGDFSGSDVCAAYNNGELPKIIEYCKDDVKRTRSIYNRLTRNVAL